MLRWKPVCLSLWVVIAVGCRSQQKPPPGEESSADGRQVVVVEIAGDVRVNGVPLTAGSTVRFETEVVVKDGRAVIEVPETGTIKVFPNTRLKIARRSMVQLALGKIWAAIAPSGRGFEVQTPNAVAGVRGTQFVVESSQEKTEVGVVEGEVAVSSRSDRQQVRTVRARQRIRVEGKAAPAEPEPYEPEEPARAWKALEELIEQLGESARDVGEAVEEGAERVGEELEEAAKETKKKAKRVKHAIEREADETRRELKKEAEKTEKELKREAKEIKTKLEEKSEQIKKELKEGTGDLKKGVKDFLD